MSAAVITIKFCGDVLYAVDRPAGVVVAIKPICQALGLDWSMQLRRIKRESIMAEGVVMMTIPSVGGAQETICLRIDLINGWLFGIDEGRVKDDTIRQRVRDYKRNCYRVLFEHFQARLDCEPLVDAVPALVEVDAAAGWPAAEIRAKTQLVNTCRVLHGVGAAQWLWDTIGLPPIPAALRAPSRAIGTRSTDDTRVARFLAERTAPQVGARVQSSFLYGVYQDWARQNGATPGNQIAFSKAMRRLGIRSKTVSVVYWLDLHCTALDGSCEALTGLAPQGAAA